MEKFEYRENYKPILSVRETEDAIRDIRHKFQHLIEEQLGLIRVTAPLFVEANKGINDDLNGTEDPVKFSIDDNQVNLEIVHSLAKWKRANISKYGLKNHEGIYAVMNAIRKDEIRDNYHSIYVDQWDFECLIAKEERNMDTLKKVVARLYYAIKKLEFYVEKKYKIKGTLPDKLAFITSEDLLQKYPDLSPEERVNTIAREYKAVFVSQIGYKLTNDVRQDGRAPDYDDWLLNGDLFVYNDILDNALELSSLGIRVDKEALINQTREDHKEYLLEYPYQQSILNEEVPYTLGGGIGQSRLCMFMLKKLHIGEVQSSYWDEETRNFFKEKGIELL